jgi:hypothetical protein
LGGGKKMKQWLYDGWFRFKAWVLFSWWKFSHTGEEHKDLVELYYKKRWEKRAMKAYIEYFDEHGEVLRKYEAESWYVGTINPEKMMNATLEKKDD